MLLHLTVILLQPVFLTNAAIYGVLGSLVSPSSPG